MIRIDTTHQRTSNADGSQQQKTHQAKAFYHCNHLGTPLALIDVETAKIIWHAEFDPWGLMKSEYNPYNIDQPIRMQGQQRDQETGLFYNRYRYYIPRVGRYVTQDPVGLQGGVHLYQYASTNPLQWTDPLGLDAVGNGAGNALVYTNMTDGYTIMLDSNGRSIIEMETSSLVTKNAASGVTGPFSGSFTYCEYPNSNKAFGPAKWRTTDERSRWIHGGGTGLKDPFAARQGWNPTLGCTRAQNEDVIKLCEKSEDFLKSNPKASIGYIRNGSMPNGGRTGAMRQ
ncbi:RHS domain-containing protein [Curvibacter sp. HBC28]|uniref:RHS domain-containing protein n=2 Tax=Curvibacter microcysteis TaxID=3026419 RepID=A0ABT5MJW4_9BURK|nr:RHS repeat-associated core domain-containing protein [Curvibacter sp. HBC28]MDD0815431.1 RHS domain-containing protein [Curvibacter sp. HBC28]